MGTTVRPSRIAVHIALILYTILALGPILLILINAFKTRRAIFADPLGLPNGQTFTTIGFDRVFANADFGLYFFNSLTVTLVSLVLIVLIGAMAAWALTEYRFPGNTLLSLYLAIGIMVPIRLGSVSILRMMVELNLVNTLTALVLVYVAQGLPLAILILGEFIQQIPKDLRDAARCDGVSEYRIFFSIILPLISPAIATVATPFVARTRAIAADATRIAGWVLAVSCSSDSGPSQQSLATSKPSAQFASSKAARASGKASAQARPMPTFCEP